MGESSVLKDSAFGAGSGGLDPGFNEPDRLPNRDIGPPFTIGHVSVFKKQGHIDLMSRISHQLREHPEQIWNALESPRSLNYLYSHRKPTRALTNSGTDFELKLPARWSSSS
jgi:hypothetical protein